MAPKMQCLCKCQIAAICRWLLSLPFPVKGLSASQWQAFAWWSDISGNSWWLNSSKMESMIVAEEPVPRVGTHVLSKNKYLQSLPLALKFRSLLEISHTAMSAERDHLYHQVIRELYSLLAKDGLSLDSCTSVLQPRAIWCPWTCRQ